MGGTTDLTGQAAFLGSSSISYSAKDVRRYFTAAPVIFTQGGEGIVESGDFAVSQRGAGANMSVDIASGEAYVKGDTNADEGSYYARETTTLNATFTASDASNPRIDRVVLEVKNDSEDSSGLNKARIRVIDGTATAGATLTNLTGAASVPNTCFLLANVLVPAGSTSVTTANIQDRRFGVPIAGRELFNGYGQIVANSNIAAGSVGSAMNIAVNGNGITPVLVDSFINSLGTTGAAGQTIAALLYDGSVSGTVLARADAHVAGANFQVPTGGCGRCRVPAFSGSKTFTMGFQTSSGTATLYAAATYPAWLRATWGV